MCSSSEEVYCRGWTQENYKMKVKKTTEERKARGCKNLSSHIPAEFPLKKGINVHWETMMTRQRKREGGGEKNTT